MKHTFKALLLLGVLFLMPVLSGNRLFAQNNFYADFDGIWVFEKAEYLEWSLPQQGYEVKQTIKFAEDLYAFGGCYQDIVTRIDVLNENSAIFFCLNNTFDGSYHFPNDLPNAPGKRVRFMSGEPEPENEASAGKNALTEAEKKKRDELKPEVSGAEYLFEFIDAHTIGIILERPCWENGATKAGAVRCILKRDLESNNHI